MSSGGLQIGTWRHGSPGFITQGQVDWIAFGNTIWQASSAVLQRFASAGIQPVTLGASLALANEFRLGRIGRQRMDEALSNLRVEYGFENILYFGFGYRSFVKIMAETQLGVNSIALCGCLCQTHGVELSAHVLAELWKEFGFPDQYEPSHTQLVLLIEACAGTLAKSTFDDTVDLMLGEELTMDNTIDSDDEDGRSVNDNDVCRPRVRASSAPDIAKVLHTLFEVSKGTIEKITVVGGSECAFVAAFAQWALGLSTLVQDRNGDLIFTSSVDDAAAQVIICYQSETSNPSISMELTGIVHHLKEPTGIFVHEHGPNLDLIIRTPWSKCLSRTFGSSFDDLMTPFHLLSSYLGSAARIYKAIATGEVYEGEFEKCLPRETFNNFVETSYGQGFVDTAVTVFPELAVPNFFERMQRAAESNITDAVKSASLASQSLCQLCRCSGCRQDDGRGARSDDSIFCLPTLANTIVQLVVQLGCAIWDPDLRPAVVGILTFYNMMKRSTINKDTEGRDMISFGLGPSEMNNTGYELLNNVRAIFDGQTTPFNGGGDIPSTTALSRNGICYYLDALRSLSSRSDVVRRVHALPGHIEKGDHRYDSIQDGETWFSNIPNGETELWTSPELPSPFETGDIEVKAMIAERGKAQTLHFYYKVVASNMTAMLQPGRLTRRILRRSGFPTCSRSARCHQKPLGRCLAARSGWRLLGREADSSPHTLTFIPEDQLRESWVADRDLAADLSPTASDPMPFVPTPRVRRPMVLPLRPGEVGRRLPNNGPGITFYIWTFSTDIARCIALETFRRDQLVGRSDNQDRQHDESDLFLRGQECLSCSMSSILRYGGGIAGWMNNRQLHIL